MPSHPLSLGATLLGRTREAVIGLLLVDASVALHVREIARRTGFSAPTVSRELRILDHVGVLRAESGGGLIRYRANAASPLYEELKSIAVKTWGLNDRLARALRDLEGIRIALVFGSMAKGAATPTSDIDLLVIGAIDFASLTEATMAASADLGRDVSPKLYRLGEWKSKLAAGNSFVRSVAAGPKVFVIGSQETLDGVGKSGKVGGARAAGKARDGTSRGRKPSANRT